MRFSQRIGLTPKEIPMQIDRVSLELRNSLWNTVFLSFVDRQEEGEGWKRFGLGKIARLGHMNFFKLPLDSLPEYGYKYHEWLKRYFFDADWHELYDFIEWLASYGSHISDWRAGNIDFDKSISFVKSINHVLAKENSGYRFVGNFMTPVTNEIELTEIEFAIRSDADASSIAKHIEASLLLLSNRNSPDFRNSIKESISAVEAAAQWSTGDKNATLGQAIKLLEKTKPLHPALKDGLSKLYGWTSDADGIRHALQETSDLNLADVRFFLVICSAFSNYLIDRAKSEKH